MTTVLTTVPVLIQVSELESLYQSPAANMAEPLCYPTTTSCGVIGWEYRQLQTAM